MGELFEQRDVPATSVHRSRREHLASKLERHRSNVWLLLLVLLLLGLRLL